MGGGTTCYYFICNVLCVQVLTLLAFLKGQTRAVVGGKFLSIFVNNQYECYTKKHPRVEFYLPKQLLWVISQVQTQILIKHLQNLDLASTSKSQPNITISTKLKLKNLDQTKPESRPRMNFIATTKHQQQNNDQTSASKSCLNINFKILNKP